MAADRHFDVVIAGAGMAGCSLALALSGQGFNIALVEPRQLPADRPPVLSGVDGFDNRVSALTPLTQQFLESIGVWQGIVDARSCPYSHMHVWDAEGTGSIDFDAREVDAERLGTIVENRVVVAAMLDRIRSSRDISVLDGKRVLSCQVEQGADLAPVVVELSSQEHLTAALLVAADGALSPVRDMMGFETREWDYGHSAIVCTIELERDHQQTAWQRFLNSGPLAFLPLDDGGASRLCSIVWSLDSELADEKMALENAAFLQELSRASEYCLGNVLAMSERSCFPLRQRHAVEYVKPAVALVGDAAHTIHPLAGQGINLGFGDVNALASVLKQAGGRSLPIGDMAVLGRYQRQRKGENLLMMAAMEGFKRLFSQRALPLRWLRNTGMSGVDRLVPVKRQLMAHAMGVPSGGGFTDAARGLE